MWGQTAGELACVFGINHIHSARAVLQGCCPHHVTCLCVVLSDLSRSCVAAPSPLLAQDLSLCSRDPNALPARNI